MKFLIDILAKAGLIVDGAVTFNNVPNATIDTDRFLVIDAGVVKYRTGSQLLSDIGGTAYGLPIGGTTGQILAKIDNTNYNVEWIDNFAPKLQHIVKLGQDMTIGTAVYVSGADGTNMIVSKASNTSEATSSKTLGLLVSGGVTNNQRYVVTEGLLPGLNTSTAIAGDPVWLGANGALLFGLINKPVAPLHMVFLGVVTRVQQNNGEIFVKVQNGYELDELHDVSLPSYINNGVLYRDTSTNLWKHATISTILGYTPANAANLSGTVNYIPKWSSASGLTNSQIIDNGTTVGIGSTIALSNLYKLGVNGTIAIKGPTTGLAYLFFTDALSSGNTPAWLSYDYANQIYSMTAAGGTGVLQFASGAGTERMRITSGGDVAIGNTSPSYKLDITGSLRNTTGANFATSSGNVGIGTTTTSDTYSFGKAVDIYGSNGAGIYMRYATDPTVQFGFIGYDRTGLGLNIQTNNALPITFYTANSEKMRITSAGNVGIGTTTPAAKLDVNSDVYFGSGAAGDNNNIFLRGRNLGVTKLSSNSGFSSNYNGFLISTNSTQVSSLPSWNFDFGGYDRFSYVQDAFSIWRTPSGGTSTNLFTVLGGGNVGIGTILPSARLHVVGTNENEGDAHGQIIARSTQAFNATPRAGIIFQITQDSAGNAAYVGSIYSQKENTGDADRRSAMIFSTRSSSGLSAERMRIASDGNVGIGTTTPVAAGSGFRSFHINGTGASITLSQNSANYHYIYTSGTLGIDLSIEAAGAMNFRAGNNLRMSIQSNGTVTIASLAGTGVRMVTADATGVLSATIANPVTGTGTANYVTKWTGTNTQGNSQIFDNGTNIGIGTTSPAAKLDIRSSGAVNQFLVSTSTTNQQNTISSLFNNGGGFGTLRFDALDLIFSSGTSATERMRINADGNVGIGTTAPVGALSINRSGSSLLTISNSETPDGTKIGGQLGLYVGGNGSGVGSFALSNDILGKVSYYGYGNNFVYEGAAIESVVTTGGNIARIEHVSALDFFTKGTGLNTPTRRMRITGAGNVGIGTTTPAERLDVNGNIQILNGGYIKGSVYSATRITIDNSLILQANNAILFNINGGTESARIVNTGNVLIGTTTDSGFKLDVNGTFNVRSNYSYFGGDANTAVYAGSFGNEGRIGVGGRSTIPTAALTFFTAEGTNNFERMRISSAGNVGIGTTTPSYKLDVSGTASGQYSRIGRLLIGIDGNGATLEAADSTAFTIFGQGGNGRLYTGVFGGVGRWGINTTSVNASVFNINGNLTVGDAYQGVAAPTNGMIVEGNVGIGTNAPIAKLHVGVFSGENIIQVAGGVDSYSTIQFGDGTGTDAYAGYIQYSHSTDQFNIGTAKVTRLIVKSNGNLEATGDVIAYSSSDIRLKENIQLITNPLEKLSRINGVTFNWKKEHLSVHGHTHDDVGVIAQEIQKILPEAVRKNDTGYYAVRYEKLIPLLIEAIKEQQSQIKEQQNEINELKKRFN